MRYLDARIVEEPELLDACTAALARGEIVVFPTDTVYGVVCKPDRLDAIARIYCVKGRPQEKPLSILVDSVDALLRYGCVQDRIAEAAARRFLPGGMTMIVPRPAHVDAQVTAGGATLGLRVPRYPLLQQLLARSGPLASTSANVSGSAAYDGVGTHELPEVDLFVDAGPTLHRRESSVINFTCEPPVMLREGILPKATFTTWLSDLDVV